MPSPICEVKDGAGAYVATTNGVNVTPANTITIRLSNVADVDVWGISCITTDDLSNAATVTSALVVDPNTKTATFTAPVAGRTYRFRSLINGGIDRNGIAQASYATTFCIYTLTGGKRVIAVDETTEGDTVFGWAASLNALIRSVGGASVAGSDTQLQYNNAGAFGALTGVTGDGVGLTALKIRDSSGGQYYTFAMSDLAADRTVTLPLLTGNDIFVFEAHTQTLTNKTLTSPVLGGTPSLSGASTSTTNNAKGTATDVNPVNVQTTDATVTTLDSFTLANNTSVVVSWLVTAVKSDNTQAAGYAVSAVFRNNAGTVTQVGSTSVTVLGEDDSVWDATADVSGTTVRLRVTGKAATTIQWTAILTRLAVIP